jgi:DNA-binding NtrC family response regulator
MVGFGTFPGETGRTYGFPVHGGTSMSEKISVLLVMAFDRRLSLVERLESCGIEVLPVSDCAEARRILRTQPAVQVVLTDEKLQDGSWCKVIEEVWQNEVGAETIVCTRAGDPGLWIHVLAHGAYDLLVEPYERKEVWRIIQSAAAQGDPRRLAAAH